MPDVQAASQLTADQAATVTYDEMVKWQETVTQLTDQIRWAREHKRPQLAQSLEVAYNHADAIFKAWRDMHYKLRVR